MDDEDMVINHLIRKMEDLDSVTVALQLDSTTLCDARAIFDAIQEKFSKLEPLIGPKADIVEYPLFESAVR